MLKSIRENEPRATSLGYRTDDYKLMAFILSADAGRRRGRHQVDRLRHRHADRRALVDVGRGRADDAVGGLGTVFGPVVGAAVIVTMQNYLAEMGAWVTVIQGVIFVACVLAFRRGLIGELGALLKVKL